MNKKEYPFNLIEKMLDDSFDRIKGIDMKVEDVWISKVIDFVDNHLTNREQVIIKMHFKEGKTLVEIAKYLGLSQGYISRLRDIAIHKIKKSEELWYIPTIVKNYQKRIDSLEVVAEIKQKKGNKKLKKDILIEDLGFSARTYNCLKRSGINTISEILELTEDEIYHIRNMGSRTTKEVVNKLAEYGLSLKEAN